MLELELMKHPGLMNLSQYICRPACKSRRSQNYRNLAKMLKMLCFC